MSGVRGAAVQDRSSVRPTGARAAARARPASEGAQAAPPRAMSPEQSVQRLIQALPARSEAPARWSGPVVQADGQVDSLPAHKVHQAAKVGISGAGGALPHLDKIQRAFGNHDVSHVVAHTDWAAKKGSEAMGARAFTTGNHVAFASQPTLHTAAHEAAHVVQQQKGVQLKGGVGRVGDPYEEHADAVADAVVSGKSAESLLAPFARGGSGGGAVQRDVNLGTRYSAPDVTTPLSQTWGNNNPNADTEISQFSDEDQKDIEQNSYVLDQDKIFYRWGTYGVEKHYFAAGGFDLKTVNQGRFDFGHGLYLADTPTSSILYAKESDGTILKVTVPAKTRIVRYNSLSSTLQERVKNAVRSPAMLDIAGGWFVLKNDKIRVRVEWYRPTQQDLNQAGLRNAFRTGSDPNNLRGHYALQIVHRQMGRAIPTPQNLPALLGNLPAKQRKRVQDYVAAVERFEYVPFMMSSRGLAFSDGYTAFNQSISSTSRYRTYFRGTLHTALQGWDRNPFAVDQSKFDQTIVRPYAAAVTSYKADREEHLSAQKLRQTGSKLLDVTTFSKRLISFRKFLRLSDQTANPLAGSLGLGSELGVNRSP